MGRSRERRSREVQAGSEGLQSKSGAYSARDVLTNTIDTVKTMLAASSHDRNNHPECDHVTIAMDVHTAFLHADVDQELFAEPPESDEGFESELREDEVWKLNRALSAYHTAPKCGIRML